MFEIQELEALFSKQPAANNIFEVAELRTFIEDYPDETLKPNLNRLLTQYKYYRPVKGDGNCYYRAIMFLYLREAQLNNYEAVFPHADLLRCKKLPIKVSRYLRSEDLLEYLWQTELLPLAELSLEKREKQLLELINRSYVIDAILVAYFRVLNYDYLLAHRKEIQPYTNGSLENDLDHVLTFGKESEGNQINGLPKILDISLQIIMVHQQNLSIIELNEEANGTKIKLFYRPGHYDILCDSQQNRRQSNTTQKQPFTQFYNQRNTIKQQNSSDFFYYQSNSNQTSISPLSFLQKPKQLRPLNNSNLNNSSQSSNGPKTLKQFKQSLRNGPQVDGQRSNKRGPIQNSQYVSPKKQILEKTTDDYSKSKVVKMKSSQLDKKDQMMRQRVLGQAALCMLVVVILVFGVFAL